MIDLPFDLKNKMTETVGKTKCCVYSKEGEAEEKGCWVVSPSSAQELSEVVKLCSSHRLPMFPSSGRLKKLPQKCSEMVVISTENMNKISDVDPVARTITLEAGVSFKEARRAAAEAGFLFPLAMNAAEEAKVGSHLASSIVNSSAFRYGSPKDLTLGLSLVLPDGTFKNSLKNYVSSEANTLKSIFVGSQGKLGFITGATLKLHPKPVDVHWMICGLDTLSGVSKLYSLTQMFGATLLTGFDVFSRNGWKLLTQENEIVKETVTEDYPWYVLIEFSSTVQNELLKTFLKDLKKEAVQKGFVKQALLAEEEKDKQGLSEMKSAFGIFINPEDRFLSYEANVPVSKVSEAMERLDQQMRYEMPDVVFLPFAQLGEGSIFLNVQPQESVKDVPLTKEEKMFTLFNDVVTQMGGAMQEKETAVKHPLLGIPEAMDMFRAVKSSFDPYNLMNPEMA